MLGLPFVPVTPTFPLLGPLGLIPYPVRYLIRYGQPLRLEEVDRGGAARAREPKAVARLAAHVRELVQNLLDEELRRLGRTPRSEPTSESDEAEPADTAASRRLSGPDMWPPACRSLPCRR